MIRSLATLVANLVDAGDLAAARRMHRFLGTWLGDDDGGLGEGATVIDLEDRRRR